MDILKIVDEKMGQNTYLIIDNEDAIVIDAGVSVNSVKEHINMFSPLPKVKAILLTHCHFDHITHLDEMIKEFDVDAFIFESGKEMLYDANKNMSCLDEEIVVKNKKNIKTFEDGSTLSFGNIEVKCYNTPGHTVDSSVFVIDDNMFTGDTVFRNCIGRNDIYSSDANVQRISLERLLNELSNGVKHFYPGHGSNFDNNDLKYNLTRVLGEE